MSFEPDRLDQYQRVVRCHLAALLAPVFTSAISFGILRGFWLFGGRAFLYGPGGPGGYWWLFEKVVFPANALIGAVLAFSIIFFFHPTPRRRTWLAIWWFLFSPVIYGLAFYVWQELYRAIV